MIEIIPDRGQKLPELSERDLVEQSATPEQQSERELSELAESALELVDSFCDDALALSQSTHDIQFQVNILTNLAEHVAANLLSFAITPEADAEVIENFMYRTARVLLDIRRGRELRSSLEDHPDLVAEEFPEDDTPDDET